MIIRTTPFKGSKESYTNVRGPDGSRYARWLGTWRAKMAERHGLCHDIDADEGTAVFERPSADLRRSLRNARKRERQIARAR